MAGPRIVMEPAPRRRRGFALGLIAVVAILGLSIYARGLGFPFSRDDGRHFANPMNPGRWQRPPAHLLDHFREDFWGGDPGSGLYRPLTAATIQMTAWWRGLQPFPLRAGNLLLQVLVAAAAAAFARRGGVSRGATLLVALLIVVHPLFSECVMEVVSRSELQATAGVLAAAALMIGRPAGDSSGKPAGVGLGAAVDGALFFLIALLSKEGAFAALPALALLLLRPRSDEGARDDGKMRQAALLLLLVAVVVVAIQRGRVLGAVAGVDPGEISPLDNALVGLGFVTRLATGVANLGRYVALLVFPRSLAPDYSLAAILPLENVDDPHLWIGVAALAGGGIWLAVSLRKRRLVESSGLLLAGASWFLVSSIATPIGTIFAERLFHMPACGLILAVVAAADRLLGAGDGARPATTASPQAPASRAPRCIAFVVALVAVAALGARSYARVGDWRDELTLYTKALEVVPESARVQATVGQGLRLKHEPDEALRHVERALAIKPDYGKALTERGVLLADRYTVERHPQQLAQAWVWFWLAAHVPGAWFDEQANLRQVAQVAKRMSLPQSELARAATEIADAHRALPLYEEMRQALAGK
jgi:protein O-mannosyl-transferase